MDSKQEQIECVLRTFIKLSRLLNWPNGEFIKNLLGDHSVADPPDPMPNSEVKRSSADGSVGFPHVRVGHRQALISTLLLIEASHHKALSFLRVLC